jgi:hypothetical protein
MSRIETDLKMEGMSHTATGLERKSPSRDPVAASSTRPQRPLPSKVQGRHPKFQILMAP